MLINARYSLLLVFQFTLSALAFAEVSLSIPASGQTPSSTPCRSSTECQKGSRCIGAELGVCGCDSSKTCMIASDCGSNGPSACGRNSSQPELGEHCGSCPAIKCSFQRSRHDECRDIAQSCNGGRLGECKKEEDIGCTSSVDCLPGHTCVGAMAGTCSCNPSQACLRASDCGPEVSSGTCRKSEKYSGPGEHCSNCPSVKCSIYVADIYQCKNTPGGCQGVRGGVCMKVEELLDIARE
jgi:hypothetical protein